VDSLQSDVIKMRAFQSAREAPKPPSSHAEQPEEDPAGAEVTGIGPDEVAELERLLASSGLAEISLRQRYTVVFVFPGIGAGDLYPELAGCTAEVCTFSDQAPAFSRYGIQLVGLSTEPAAPEGNFLSRFPFHLGRLPRDFNSPLIERLERDGRAFARRTTFLIYPDATGVRIGTILDSSAHVRRCFELITARRLEAYRQAVARHLHHGGAALRPALQLRTFLPNGADSVSITQLGLRSELVCKMADPRIVAEEAGYMDRINGLLHEHGRPPLFPAVVAICADERPGWYLMEAASPLALDGLLFADDARTTLKAERRPLLHNALRKLSNLYEITFRREIPKVARYHYRDRFHVIPSRADFRATIEFVFAGETGLDELLTTRLQVGDILCRSYREQLQFLDEAVDELVQPVGAYLHGDVHLPNMLIGRDGDVVFIDPRVVWDGNDVGDPGFGDPSYDFATLLHSLHYMSAILKAIEDGDTEALLTLQPARDDRGVTWRVTGGLLQLHQSPTVEWFKGWIGAHVPAAVLGAHWQTRLHIGTANATLGWLKYARSVKTRHAWMAIFAATLYHLEVGRRWLERTGA